MCINLLTQYACGHAKVEFMNRYCQCTLIVGPVVEKRERCGRIECGGKGAVRGDIAVEAERMVGEERRDGAMAEGEEKKVVMYDGHVGSMGRRSHLRSHSQGGGG